MEKIKAKVGEKFTLLGLEWKVLEVTENGYKCLAERLEDNMSFGKDNDWKESRIRKYLNGEFYDKLADAVRGTLNMDMIYRILEEGI